MLNKKWLERIDIIDYSYQSIINSFTGITFAVEALMRNFEKIGFKNPHDFFDEAYKDGVLFAVDIYLRKKAIKKFKEIEFSKKIKLFYNYDPRILEMRDYSSGETENILEHYGLNHDQICFEISEKYKINCLNTLNSFVISLKMRGIKIALDDFGSGFAGFELFYYSDPDYLKFDRFLIKDIDSDIRKKSFCSHIVNLCKLLGVIVIAEGIETEKEFNICKEIGIDLIQGFFIQSPVLDIENLSYMNSKIRNYEVNNKRYTASDNELISKEIIKLDTININDDMRILFEKFHDKLGYNFFPVLDTAENPLGIIHEKQIKKYVYSPYGKDLLSNKSITKNLQKFITKIPVIDIDTPQDKILEIFVNNPESVGVIITKNLKYFGFLNARSLLNIINERNISYAREINPLSKLPGNILINKYIFEVFNKKELYHYLIYFDFDYFKPFNDNFGFRQGDRVIAIFADILKKNNYFESNFIGHIGGDDFFAGIQKDMPSFSHVIFHVKNIIWKFNNEILSFYSKSEVHDGFYISKDRAGSIKTFPILSLCAAIIEIFPGERRFTHDDISQKLAELKKEAKDSDEKISILSITKNYIMDEKN